MVSFSMCWCSPCMHTLSVVNGVIQHVLVFTMHAHTICGQWCHSACAGVHHACTHYLWSMVSFSMGWCSPCMHTLSVVNGVIQHGLVFTMHAHTICGQWCHSAWAGVHHACTHYLWS